MKHRTCRPSRPQGDSSLQDAYEQIKLEFDDRVSKLEMMRKQIIEFEDRIKFLEKKAQPLAIEFDRTMTEANQLYHALNSLASVGAGLGVSARVEVPSLVHTVMRSQMSNDENPFTEDIPF